MIQLPEAVGEYFISLVLGFFMVFLAGGSLLCHSLYEGQHYYMNGLLLSFLPGKGSIAVKSLTI